MTQRAPLTATALAFEFTHADWTLLAPVLLAVGLAVSTARLVDRGGDGNHRPPAPGT